jgi:signal recognition particle subunit SRP19
VQPEKKTGCTAPVKFRAPALERRAPGMADGEPGAASSSIARYDDYTHDKRIIIYPVYLNSKATIADGRLIAADHGVENPTLGEIIEVLKHLGYQPALEDKIYSRDALARGRIRVNLRDASTGELTVPEIASRKQLLRKLGESIPNLKSRKEPSAKAPAPALDLGGAQAMPMVPGMGSGLSSAGMSGRLGMPAGFMPPRIAGMMPPGMAGTMPPGMAGLMPPGMAGMMPPGMAGMLQGMGMGAPQPGPGEGKIKGGKKKGRK